jgi:hypothetical protein
MDDDDDHYAPAPVPPRAQQRRRCPPQSMDESGQGPKTAVAVAVASPLGVQPSIDNTVNSSSIGQPLGTNAAYISYALRPVLRPCLAVGRRRCRSPKAGVRELHKAAPEAPFIGPSGHRCPLHINGCKTSKEVVPGAQCVCIGGYICRSPPPACQYTEGVPPPRRGAERNATARDGCRAGTVTLIFRIRAVACSLYCQFAL